MFVQCNKQFNLRKKVDLLLRLSCCIYGEQVWKLLSDFEGTSKKGKGKCYNNFDNGRKWEKNMKKKKKSKKKYYLQASETKPDFLYLLWLQVF